MSRAQDGAILSTSFDPSSPHIAREVERFQNRVATAQKALGFTHFIALEEERDGLIHVKIIPASLEAPDGALEPTLAPPPVPVDPSLRWAAGQKLLGTVTRVAPALAKGAKPAGKTARQMMPTPKVMRG